MADRSNNERPPNVLGDDPRPKFFPLGNARKLGLVPPRPRHRIAHRIWARSLAGMQKEAMVTSSVGPSWRLISDEGPYLDGYDEGPFPLSHMTTGMVASYANELLGWAQRADLNVQDLQLTLHSYYSMEGSALKGTMLGGALPPELEVDLDTDADADTIEQLVARAITSSPVHGLLTQEHTSRFTLTLNGRQLEPGEVAALDREPPFDPGRKFEDIEVGDGDAGQPLIELATPADEVQGEGGVGSSYAESQSRILHVRGVCRLGEDGLKEIELHLHKPVGSTFRFRSDESPELGGNGRAPDATSYISAGIAFCFMTQFGRYARIAKKQLDGYRIVQDTHFTGGVHAGDETGMARAVETDVFLDTPEGEEFARKVVDMSERTCFLHALCRTQLEPEVRLPSRA